jgi:CxxC motif-containing protein (DUF1111 family)
MRRYFVASLLSAAIISLLFLPTQVTSQTTAATSTTFKAADPGVRPRLQGDTTPGNPLPGLTAAQLALFTAGQADFAETEAITDGLGPRMNLDSCGGCHAQPAVGGTSPAVNPQVKFANLSGMDNILPSFIDKLGRGPVREARFIKNADGSPDGGVHSLFTIQGYTPDANGCMLAQPDFATAVANKNVIFRIPTPVFGAGLIEQIPDTAILANQASNAAVKRTLGIRGRPNIVLSGSAISGQANHNGNDGTAARFGWKAQNKSLLLFSGEAYNVEMGITNDLFQTERDEAPGCQFATTPNDTVKANALTAIENFAVFMRFLAPPTPSANLPGGSTSIGKGKILFSSVGCDQCHTAKLSTGNSTIAALNNKPAFLYSDLLIHDMGPGLADGVSQGQAGPSEFRTAPLWGLGQRIFLLHDGRTANLVEAIHQHQSGNSRDQNASEANAVISNFNNLSEWDKQNLLNFLRSL